MTELVKPANALPGSVPVNCAAARLPTRLLAEFAKMAYGVGVIFWRGNSAVKFVTPDARTAMSSQRSGPVKMPAPKSSVTSNSPLLAGTERFVSEPLMAFPLVTASKTANRRS
jgi:hypothetical protein